MVLMYEELLKTLNCTAIYWIYDKLFWIRQEFATRMACLHLEDSAFELGGFVYFANPGIGKFLF